MDKRTKIAIVIALVVVAVVVIYIVSSVGNNGSPGAGTAETPATTTGGSATRGTLSGNVEIPGQGATGTPQGVAVPTTVGPGNPTGSTSYRVFNIQVSQNAFTPNTIIVREGDTVRISVTAAGGNFDFTQPDYGLKLSVSNGQSKSTQFDATAPGKFTFYCASCGGPSKGPIGYLEVAAK